MLTTPITTPYFQSRVLTLLSSHTSQSSFDESHSSLTNSAINLPLLIPPLGPSDTAITPNETISQLLAVASPWIDLCSPDPVIQDISQQVLSLEIAYAAFCGVGNIITSGPKLHHGKVHGDALVQYARAISDALSVAINVQIEILLPMTDQPGSDVDDSMGSLTQLARDDYVGDVRKETARKPDMYGSWDAWNVIRTVCKYNSRLFVGKRTRRSNICSLYIERVSTNSKLKIFLAPLCLIQSPCGTSCLKILDVIYHRLPFSYLLETCFGALQTYTDDRYKPSPFLGIYHRFRFNLDGIANHSASSPYPPTLFSRIPKATRCSRNPIRRSLHATCGFVCRHGLSCATLALSRASTTRTRSSLLRTVL